MIRQVRFDKKQRVVDELIRRIESGLMEDGFHLPGEHQLAQEFKVSRGTLREALDLTTIIVSHDVGETLSIADYIYIIAEGVIQGEGTPAELKQHESAFVRQFLTGAAEGPVDYQFSHKAYLTNSKLFFWLHRI